MALIERVAQDLTAAMKAKDAGRTAPLRMAKAALKNKEIDKRAPLDEAEALKVIQGLVKQREDSIEQFKKGNRLDLVAKEQAEIDVLAAYVPQGVSEADIVAAVDKAVAETGASSPKDLGRVMKVALAALEASGRAVDGKRVNAAVRARLGG